MRAVATTALLGVLATTVTGCGFGVAVKSGVIARAASGDGSADTCAEVRAGIDAFNAGDFEATVAHFTAAVPLAHAAVVAHDTRAAEQLLEAVVYYAQLPPQDYLSAAQSSPDFAKYKVITLGQCESGDQAPPSASSAPGVPA